VNAAENFNGQPGPEGCGDGSQGGLVECELVKISDEEDVLAAVLWLNRPESLNAMSWEMLLELQRWLTASERDPRVRVVLVTGRGRGFSAGGDLKAYIELQSDGARFERFVQDTHRTFGGIRAMSKPVVALVNGVTAAGGLELLLSCDFAYAAESAKIGDLHLNFAQIGGGGSLALLPRAIGPARARELVFSARQLDASEALEWGLVTSVTPDDALLEAGLEFARRIAAHSARAMRTAKLTLNRGLSTGLEEALQLEADATTLYCAIYPDSMEGLQAFVDRTARRRAEREAQEH
jgi:enoyl-CoA hydratase/carnithine racemase